MPHIAIVWDFDKTLAPEDSTTKVVETIQGEMKGGEFWKYVKSLRGDKDKDDWEHILASDAPIWMYALSRIASVNKVPLNTEFFQEFVVKQIKLFPNVLKFLKKIKDLEKSKEYKALNLEVHHFIVSAGLKDLIQLVFPDKLITWVFGCRYSIILADNNDYEPESVPVFCMDETMKTRSLFEISKGSFNKKDKHVNNRIDKNALWAPFENIIYIGDSDTDVPALSLTRDKGGLGVVVFNKKADKVKTQGVIEGLRKNKRADLITPADFSLKGELFKYLETRCNQIKQRYAAE